MVLGTENAAMSKTDKTIYPHGTNILVEEVKRPTRLIKKLDKTVDSDKSFEEK